MGFTKDEIRAALSDKGPLRSCPMCGGGQFSATEGVVNLSVSQETNRFEVEGPSIPAVVISCDQCGLITMHSALALGLI